MARTSCREALNNPQKLARLHFWLAIGWMFPGVILAWVIVYRMPDPHAAFAILVVSLYANCATHWGAYQAVRAELEAAKLRDAS
jgi:hypothetical protein